MNVFQKTTFTETARRCNGKVKRLQDMKLHTHHLIAMTDMLKPTLVIPAVPPSDNRRKTRNPRTGQIVTSGDVRVFQGHTSASILSQGVELPPPPVVVLYRVFFKDKRRDVTNCGKALLDALYKQDKHVAGWAIPFNYTDKESPRTEVWIVELETGSPLNGVTLRTQ